MARPAKDTTQKIEKLISNLITIKIKPGF